VNVNTIKTALSFTDYVSNQVKCDNTAWQLKFNNSWSECDYWGGYNYFSIVAQVYEFDVIQLPKGTKFKFPLYVKSYNPEIFSNYTFNKVERPTINVKEFIVGNIFTLNQDVNNTILKFYLTSDVKLSKSNILNKYKLIYLGSVFNISVYSISSVNVVRYINSPMLFSLNAFINDTELRYINSSLDFTFTIIPTVYNDRYLTTNANFSLYSSVYIQPNCRTTYWVRKFEAWRDCDTWS
jgi:hypothetical protein